MPFTVTPEQLNAMVAQVKNAFDGASFATDADATCTHCSASLLCAC
jgi:hypothetical protein